MIKVDGCYACENQYADGYKAFGWYMNHTERPMLYSCSWPAYVDKNKACFILIRKLHFNILSYLKALLLILLKTLIVS